MNRTKEAEREIFQRWHMMTKAERIRNGLPIHYKILSQQLGVGGPTLTRWRRELEESGLFTPKGRDGRPKGSKRPRELPQEMLSQLGPVETGFWTEERVEAVNKAILESAQHGNANAQKLAKQLSGELVEKKEIKIVLNADDYFRIRREAQARIQRLTGEGNGDRGLLPESALLLPEDGVHTEHEHDEDGEVAAVGISA